MTDSVLPVSHVLKVDEVPPGGVEIDLSPERDELDRIARFLDIPAVTSLRATLVVAPWRGRGLSVRGRVIAEVVQTCVVSLEPMDNTIAEDVAVHLAPDVGDTSDPQDDRDIEPLVDGRVDVGALMLEHLALGLDPYPRRADAALERPQDDADDGPKSPGPFAALSVLRHRRPDR